jgi:flagella basal body P-ring formation protein FlgA
MMRSFAAAFVALAIFGCVPAVACAQATTQTVPGKRFEALAAPIGKAVHLNGDAQLIQAFPIPNQTLPLGRLSLVVGNALVTPAYVNVPIQIDIDGTLLRTIFVGYRVQRYVSTAVAAHDLLPGAVLTAQDLTMARVRANGQRENGMQALVGRRVLDAIRSGQPIALENTQIDQIVKAGSTVTLIVNDNGVSIVADVVARSSGGLGEHVSLYDPQTNKALTGTVIGPDRVELNLSEEVQ